MHQLPLHQDAYTAKGMMGNDYVKQTLQVYKQANIQHTWTDVYIRPTREHQQANKSIGIHSLFQKP